MQTQEWLLLPSTRLEYCVFGAINFVLLRAIYLWLYLFLYDLNTDYNRRFSYKSDERSYKAMYDSLICIIALSSLLLAYGLLIAESRPS